MSSDRILVMGVGNPLMRDEGVGPRTVEILMAGYEFPDNVEVMDCGTMGYSIMDVMRDIDKLIVIDAVETGELEPGTVVRLEPEDFAESQILHSLHDVRIPEVLKALSLVSTAPETFCIGVQIEAIEQWVLELSPSVEAALPVAVAATLEELRELGVTPVERADTSVNAEIIAAVRSYAPMPDAELPAD